MWGSLTNSAVKGVALLLTAIALLGFYLGVRGAMPTSRDSEENAPAASSTGPVQDVQPIQEVIPPPPIPEPKAEDANLAAEKAAEEEAEEDEDPITPLPPPTSYARPPAANTAPADPIGNLIQEPPPEETPPEPVPF
jgi:hypothetical protein